jgi:hypothetical protein
MGLKLRTKNIYKRFVAPISRSSLLEQVRGELPLQMLVLG